MTINYRLRTEKAVLEIRHEGQWPKEHYRLYVDNEPTEIANIDPVLVLGSAWCGAVEHDFFQRYENVEKIPHSLEQWESIYL